MRAILLWNLKCLPVVITISILWGYVTHGWINGACLFMGWGIASAYDLWKAR